MKFSTVPIGIVVFVVWCSYEVVQSKVYGRCEFVRAARRYFPAHEIDDWTCLAKYESTFNTKATHKNSDGSTDFGIFQINNRWWCSPGPHNVCKVRCVDLMSDDLRRPSRCAKLIKKYQGFKAWVAWVQRCSNGRSRGASAGC